MPKVTIWIRNEDWETWKAIKSKPEFIHGVLKQLKSRISKEPEVVKTNDWGA